MITEPFIANDVQPSLPLQSRVEALLRVSFPEAEIHLEALPTGTLTGVVVSDRFARWKSSTRVRSTLAPLKVLSEQERRLVPLLAALTHAEYASWLDDQRYW